MDRSRVRPTAMKDSDQIARINSNSIEDVVAHVVTWQLSRVFRRDFNRMTYKMFLLASKFNSQQRIQLRLHEMQVALHVLQNLASKVPEPGAINPADVTRLEIRLVSPEARILYEALLKMDMIMHLLLSQHDEETTDEICADFFAAYGRLKYALFRKKETGGEAPAPAPASNETSQTDASGMADEAAPLPSFSLKAAVGKLLRRFGSP